MARRFTVVTRTIPLTVCKVLCMDTETKTAVTKEVTLVGKKGREAIFVEKLKAKVETETLKFVSYELLSETEVLRGMTEETFYNNSIEITNRTQLKGKFINE